MLAIEKATGKTPPELDIPPVPRGSSLIIEAFDQLHGTRPSGGFGISPIPLSEIVAWQRVMRVRLTPWEVETILLIDRAAMNELMEDEK